MTLTSCVPILYFPLAIAGLAITAWGYAHDSELLVQRGMQLTAPAILLTLFIAALFSFAGVLRLLVAVYKGGRPLFVSAKRRITGGNSRMDS